MARRFMTTKVVSGSPVVLASSGSFPHSTDTAAAAFAVAAGAGSVVAQFFASNASPNNHVWTLNVAADGYEHAALPAPIVSPCGWYVHLSTDGSAMIDLWK